MIARLLISLSQDIRVGEINKILAENDLSFNHPDLLYLPYDSKLGIAEARKIKNHFALKPYSAKGRTVVLEDASALTVEAQNALLKTLEELPPEAVFVLGASSDTNLLPTVLSRCQIVILESSSVIARSEATKQSTFQNDIEKLLKSTTEERFEYIEKLKDREEFLRFMVSYFHKRLISHPGGAMPEFLKELLQVEEWAEQNVSIRAILEYLMLIMPNEV